MFVLALGLLGWPALTVAHEVKQEQHEERLPTIGAAPDFALISQDGAEVTLAALRGKVVALTFIYASPNDHQAGIRKRGHGVCAGRGGALHASGYRHDAA